MKTPLILIQRELWEHRLLWIVPLAVAAVMLLGINALPGHISLVGGFDLSSEPQSPPPGARLPQPVAFELAMFGVSAPFYIAAAILAVSYLLDCLYAERRDRSVLFWRSLPVSDTATVLAKLVVGLVLLPLGTYLVAALTSLAVAMTTRLHSGSFALPDAFLWNASAWLQVQGVMLYVLVATLLWYAPYAAYLLLVSAWARRSVYAWAFIPPVVAAVLEHALFGTHYVGRVIQRGFHELTTLAFSIDRQLDLSLGEAVRPGHGGGRGWGPVPDPSRLLESPQMWLGLAAAALMIAAAIQVRRRRDDS
jgi:ABC-2 type transport system permease protein